jgi:hypothetical protein
MKSYREHRCSKVHHRPTAFAKCAWPRAAWVQGDGPYAVLAHCRVLTVQLHPDPEHAEAAKRTIDETGCGGGCYRAHEVVFLDLSRQVGA